MIPQELSNCKSSLIKLAQSHHALRPVFLHILGQFSRDEEYLGSVWTPGLWEPFYQMPDV